MTALPTPTRCPIHGELYVRTCFGCVADQHREELHMSNPSPFPTYRETVLERARATLDRFPPDHQDALTCYERECAAVIRSLVNELAAEPLAGELLEVHRLEVRAGAVYTFDTGRGALFITVKNIEPAGRLLLDIDGTDAEVVRVADFVAMLETGILEPAATIGAGGYAEELRRD